MLRGKILPNRLSHYVSKSPNKKHKTMIEEFIDSTLIIDEKKEEVAGLISLLEKKDIYVKHYHPDELNGVPLKNRKIIFLDLFLDDRKDEINNIALIRKILKYNIGNNFGTYGIVMWTNHTDKVEMFREKVQLDSKVYTLPLFIIALSKTSYLREGNFDNLFDDLNRKLKESFAANFFVSWSMLVSEGKDKVIKNLYSLENDYKLQNSNLEFILFEMARNLNGIPLNQIDNYPIDFDAFKSLNDMLNHEIVTTSINYNHDFFNDYKKIHYAEINDYKYYIENKFKYKDEFINIDKENGKDDHSSYIKVLEDRIKFVKANLNYIYLLDQVHISQDQILPGNIYQIMNDEGDFIMKDMPEESIPIIIEMSPPCDFSSGKMINSKVLSGFITKFTKNKLKNYNKECYHKEIRPILIKENDNEIKMIIFDFRYYGIIEKSKLKIANNFKIIFRAKEKLFADLLQKLSSYNSRLGLSIIH
jgi:hypothetical protein